MTDMVAFSTLCFSTNRNPSLATTGHYELEKSLILTQIKAVNSSL